MPAGGQGGFLESPSGQATSATFVNYVGALLARYATGTTGTGRMAARGIAQQNLKVSQQQFALEEARRNVELAYADFARTNPFEEGFMVETPGGLGALSEKTLKLVRKNVQKLTQLAAKKQTGKVIRKEKKIAAQIQAREAKLAPYTEVRISELRGPNAGYWRERGAPPPLFLTQRNAG